MYQHTVRSVGFMGSFSCFSQNPNKNVTNTKVERETGEVTGVGISLQAVSHFSKHTNVTDQGCIIFNIALDMLL